MTVDEVFFWVKRAFGDESSVQITDEDLFRWINGAQREVVLQNEEILQTVITTDLVADQNEYPFPADALVVRTLRMKTASMLSYQYILPLNLQEFDKLIDGWDGTVHGTSQTSFYFTIYERSIFLFPTPDRSTVDGLKILYSRRPTEIALTTDPIVLPEEYHNAIVTYMIAQANVLDEDYEASSLHKAEFANQVRMNSFKHQEAARETYPTITCLPEDY